MKTSWKPFILLAALVFSTACSPRLTEAEMTATQEALASSTPTGTHTPTVTNTLPPTLTPTITLSPTPTTPPIVVERREDGSSLIRILSSGFQFVLPSGWTYKTPTLASLEQGWETWPIGGDGASVVLTVQFVDSNQSAESAYESRANLFDYADDVDVILTGGGANQHDVPMLSFEARGEFQGKPNFHEYSIFFESNGGVIHFEFSGNINLIGNAILSIQNSIQLID